MICSDSSRSGLLGYLRDELAQRLEHLVELTELALLVRQVEGDLVARRGSPGTRASRRL